MPKLLGVSGLRPAQGAVRKAKRYGRGGKRGGTSGRGHKGQKARSGNHKPGPGFEGGQTPITLRFPKRGFTNFTRREYAVVNLDRLQHWIDIGKLKCSPDKPITALELEQSNCVHGAKGGIKLLSDGAMSLRSAVFIQPSKASKTAIRAIEQKGGGIICRYYNALAMRDCLNGRTDRKAAAPTRREDIEWYSDFKHRGYLDVKSVERWSAAAKRWQTARDAGLLVTSMPPSPTLKLSSSTVNTVDAS
ncbi:YmL10 [Serendipita sp. 396]|nr:YmL10 [Serendipita sp. 396]KAG8788754.1 YmL10 [Serendipita sp. 397]KAG8827037.1 YmL10 [Serendipita sp. 401]KAG8839704.1 YmL10 [Serendipita sp. 400]KAG9057455.1 YmL10 [Serendipita sp. 407]